MPWNTCNGTVSIVSSVECLLEILPFVILVTVVHPIEAYMQIGRGRSRKNRVRIGMCVVEDGTSQRLALRRDGARKTQEERNDGGRRREKHASVRTGTSHVINEEDPFLCARNTDRVYSDTGNEWPALFCAVYEDEQLGNRSD